MSWCLPGTENHYNIIMMEELQSVLSLGAGGVTKLVDRSSGRIVRLTNPKYPTTIWRCPPKFWSRRTRSCASTGRFEPMAYQLQEINRRIKTDVTEFLEECDQAYAQRVSLAADRILSNLDKSPVVLLSGPSGSGKTTTAMKIAEELQRRGVNTHAVAMDNYFKSLNRKTAPRTPRETSTTNLPSAWIWSCWTSTSPP